MLVVDRDGRFYWWPRWLNLTTSTGWLRSVATNYQRGYAFADELHVHLVEFVHRKLARVKKGTDISIQQVFDWVLESIKAQGNELYPSRTQVFSSPDWSVRFLVCDRPRLDFVPLTFPSPSLPRHRHPFPLEWMMSTFKDAEIPAANIGRESHPAASQLDVLLGEDQEVIKSYLASENSVLRRALSEIGLPKNEIRTWGTDERLKVMMASLGYGFRREYYYRHFETLARKDDLDTLAMLKLVEARVVEVYEAWVRSFRQVLDVDHDGFLRHLNEGQGRPFSPKRKRTLGTVQAFIERHRSQLKMNCEYTRWLKHKIPSEMLQLVDAPTEHRLRLLTYMRNQRSHPPTMDPDEAIARLQTAQKAVGWSVATEWDTFQTKQNVQEFFRGFFGNADQPCRVPTLMQVTRIEANAHGTSAVLVCQRNGTEHRIRLDEKRCIERYDAGGQLVANHDRERELMIGQRMYVLPTTNPALVDPIILYA